MERAPRLVFPLTVIFRKSDGPAVFGEQTGYVLRNAIGHESERHPTGRRHRRSSARDEPDLRRRTLPRHRSERHDSATGPVTWLL
jgi:hypothetical protein